MVARIWVWRCGLIVGGQRPTLSREWISNHDGPCPDSKGQGEEHGEAKCTGKPNRGWDECHTMLNIFWLTNFYTEQVLGTFAMDQPVKGCGRGIWGKVPRNGKQTNKFEPCRGRKSINHIIREATMAYREGTDEGIRKTYEE